MQKTNPKIPIRKPQHQSRPGNEYKMDPIPVYNTTDKGNGKLYNKSRLIFKNSDKVLGFAHLILNEQKALLKFKLSSGQSPDRKDGCFEIIKNKSIQSVPCS